MSPTRWRIVGVVGFLTILWAVGPWVLVLATGSLLVPRVRATLEVPTLTRRSLRRGTVVGASLLAMLAAVIVVPDGVLPIPPGAGSLVTPGYLGRPALAQPISLAVPQNPALAPNGASAAHNDTWSTDTYSASGPLGESPQVDTAWFGLKHCGAMLVDGAERLVARCETPRGPSLRVLDPESMRPRATLDLVSEGDGPSPLCGTSFYIDLAGRVVVGAADRTVLVVETSDGRGEADLTVETTYDVGEAVETDDCLVALLPDFSGRIWWASHQGRVGFVEPGTGRVRSLDLGEEIANALSIDRSGGVFVATTRALYQVRVDAAARPVVGWRTIYDSGTGRKRGQSSPGTGTTPTLLPGGLVAIADNAQPRMHVQFYRSDNGRLVCQEPVFEDDASATDSSLTAVASAGVVVRNSAGDSGRASTIMGRAPAGGLARVEVIDGDCETIWTNPEVTSGSAAKLSLATGLLYATTKRQNIWGVNAWYFTAVDARTGQRIWSVRTGIGLMFDPHGSTILIGPEASAYVASGAGVIRIRDRTY